MRPHVAGYLFSLRTAWWMYWREDEPIRELLARGFREQWRAKVEAILQKRGLTWPQFDDMMRWDEYTRRRLLQGAFTKDGGMPALYACTMAARLGVPRDDVLPGDRELFVEATHRLCTKFASLAGIARRQCQAYVEYHLQRPHFRPGVLDAEAAERAFQSLRAEFAEPRLLAEAIVQTAGAVDTYLVNIL